MPEYQEKERSTLLLRVSGETVVELTFDPIANDIPRVTSPAKAEDTEIYPIQARENLRKVKKWAARAELNNGYIPAPIEENYLKVEIDIRKSGKVKAEITIGLRDENGDLITDPELAPPPFVLNRKWDPANNIITTDARGEFDISYPALQFNNRFQETFLALIQQITETGQG